MEEKKYKYIQECKWKVWVGASTWIADKKGTMTCGCYDNPKQHWQGIAIDFDLKSTAALNLKIILKAILKYK